MKIIYLKAFWAFGMVLISLFHALCPTNAFAANPKPMFSSDEVIQIRIEAPFKTLIQKSDRSTDAYPAKLTLHGSTPETHTISLAARGKSRRTHDVCRFPPLRLKFSEKPPKESFFKGQKSLKLVTHCKNTSKNQQYTMLEYSAYRMYNEITNASLRVRLAEIEYVEAGSGKVVAKRFGFFIEDTDDLAKRNGQKEIDIKRTGRSKLQSQAAVRVALFQYMIGNLDWSLTSGAAGADCCHNAKLIGLKKTSTTDLTPIPYDFDHSGLVDTDYAYVPENLKINSVRERVYRGFCINNEEAQAQATNILTKKTAILDVFSNIPNLSKGRKDRAIYFLQPFFKTLSDPKKFEKRIIKKCL
jgi:hypothetical protein